MLSVSLSSTISSQREHTRTRIKYTWCTAVYCTLITTHQLVCWVTHLVWSSLTHTLVQLLKSNQKPFPCSNQGESCCLWKNNAGWRHARAYPNFFHVVIIPCEGLLTTYTRCASWLCLHCSGMVYSFRRCIIAVYNCNDWITVASKYNNCWLSEYMHDFVFILYQKWQTWMISSVCTCMPS